MFNTQSMYNCQSQFDLSLEHSFSNFSKDSGDIELIDVENLSQVNNALKAQSSSMTYDNEPILKSYEENQFLMSAQENSLDESYQEISKEEEKGKSKNKKESLKTKPITKSQKKKDKEPNCKKRPSNSKCNNSPGFFIGTAKSIFKKFGQLNINNQLVLQWDNSQSFVFELAEYIQVQTLRTTLNKFKVEIQKVGSKKGKKSQLQKFLNQDNEEFTSISELKEIFGDYIKMKKYAKLTKEILRKQLIYVLGIKNWIQDHSKQRQFKPENDDQYGTKKNQKEKDYSKYLHYTRDSLLKNRGLENRSSMRIHSDSKEKNFQQNFQR